MVECYKQYKLSRYASGKKRGVNNSKSPTYRSWYSMLARCYTPSYKNYHRWGGRGIRVCDRWLDAKSGYANFISDMGERPSGMSLDRMNIDGDYCLDNCRWATPKQQMNNTSKNVHIKYLGLSYTASELSDLIGIKRGTLLYRYRKNKRLDAPIDTSGVAANTKAHCSRGHDLRVSANIFYRKNGSRECRLCANQRMRDRRAVEKLYLEKHYE